MKAALRLAAPDLSRLAKASETRAVAVSAPEMPAGWKLVRLKPRHRQIAALLVTGLDRESVAHACGCTPALVTLLQKQPVFQEHMKELQAQVDADLSNLMGKAVRAVDRALDSHQETADQLRAADMVFKTQGAYKPDGVTQAVSAEDIVARLLQAAQAPQVAVQVNVGVCPGPGQPSDLTLED